MSEESTSPDLVQLVLGSIEALNRREPDAVVGFFAPGAVVEATGLGTSFEGAAAIRGFVEDWMRTYDEHAFEVADILDLGGGVVLTVNRQRGRLVGSTAEVRLRDAWIHQWAEARIARLTLYLNPDDARAAAERLAKERA